MKLDALDAEVVKERKSEEMKRGGVEERGEPVRREKTKRRRRVVVFYVLFRFRAPHAVPSIPEQRHRMVRSSQLGQRAQSGQLRQLI